MVKNIFRQIIFQETEYTWVNLRLQKLSRTIQNMPQMTKVNDVMIFSNWPSKYTPQLPKGHLSNSHIGVTLCLVRQICTWVWPGIVNLTDKFFDGLVNLTHFKRGCHVIFNHKGHGDFRKTMGNIIKKINVITSVMEVSFPYGFSAELPANKKLRQKTTSNLTNLTENHVSNWLCIPYMIIGWQGIYFIDFKGTRSLQETLP